MIVTDLQSEKSKGQNNIFPDKIFEAGINTYNKLNNDWLVWAL